MSKARLFMPINRLAKMLGDSNGILFAHAIQHAETNLAKVRPAHEAALTRKLDALRDLAPSAHADAEQRAAFYRLAQDVLTDSGGLGADSICRAARSLCDLLASDAAGPRLRQGVAVHLEAITALRASAGANDGALREAILAGLARIAGKPSI